MEAIWYEPTRTQNQTQIEPQENALKTGVYLGKQQQQKEIHCETQWKAVGLK